MYVCCIRLIILTCGASVLSGSLPRAVRLSSRQIINFPETCHTERVSYTTNKNGNFLKIFSFRFPRSSNSLWSEPGHFSSISRPKFRNI